jgi:hypothetical protein
MKCAHAALARLDDRARIARRVAILAALLPLGCHLAAPLLGFDAAPAAALAEVLAAVALRLAGVTPGAGRPRARARRPAAPTPPAARLGHALAS